MKAVIATIAIIATLSITVILATISIVVILAVLAGGGGPPDAARGPFFCAGWLQL